MTKKEFDSLNTFPVQMVTKVRYEASWVELKPGDEFTGASKKTIGENDYSIIDSNGYPHYYADCDLLYKDSE